MKITLPPCSLMYRKYKKKRNITVFTLLSALEETQPTFVVLASKQFSQVVCHLLLSMDTQK